MTNLRKLYNILLYCICTMMAVGLGKQLDRATSLKLVGDMKSAAHEVTAHTLPQS